MMLIAKNKNVALAIVLFLHVSFLDLVVMTPHGLVVLWQNNLQWLTLLVHLATVITAVLFYIVLRKMVIAYANNKLSSNRQRGKFSD